LNIDFTATKDIKSFLKKFIILLFTIYILVIIKEEKYKKVFQYKGKSKIAKN
jgi:uncharacterized protein YqhQ